VGKSELNFVIHVANLLPEIVLSFQYVLAM